MFLLCVGPYACMHGQACVSEQRPVCPFMCLHAYLCAYTINSARERQRERKRGRGLGLGVVGGWGVENDPGADTYETGGLIHKHSSKAPGPGNLRGKLLTSQPWRPHCLLCMRSCDML